MGALCQSRQSIISDIDNQVQQISRLQNPGINSHGASVLLGLSYLNASRDRAQTDEGSAEAFKLAVSHLSGAYKTAVCGDVNTSTCAAMTTVFLASNNVDFVRGCIFPLQ